MKLAKVKKNFSNCYLKRQLLSGLLTHRREKFAFLKIRQTYPTIMKLGTLIPYLKKILKMYKLHDTLVEFC